MVDLFFCRECGETVVWGKRVRRWTHAEVDDDHAITLAKRGALPGEGKPDANPLDYREEPLVEREMISKPLEYLCNIGTVGTLDGEEDDRFSNRQWIDLRYLIDRVWSHPEIGGKPCPTT